MKRDPTNPAEASELRRKAEERLSVETSETKLQCAEVDTQRLIHELQVHQIELEMQNVELRQTRDEMELLLTQYTELYDFAPVGYLTLDCDGIIHSVNLTCASLLGIERSRLVGASFINYIPMLNRPGFRAFLSKVIEKQTSDTCECLLHTADHPPFYAMIKAVISDPGDKCLVAVIDITKNKQAEKTLNDNQLLLQKHNELLEHRISDEIEKRGLEKMLLVQNRQAAMGRMISCIAHQWRQPLNTLGLYILELGQCYGTSDFSREFLDKSIFDSMKLIEYMSQTIDDFRHFYRTDKAAVIFDVKSSINATVSLIQDSLRSHRIVLETHVQGAPRINGYPSEYSQALLNIIMNAQDALLEHKGKIEQPRIVLSAFVEDYNAVVTIADNAGGLPEEILDLIYEPYFTTRGPDKGTGIGLYMAKTIIEKNMGGRLTVRNLDNGAEFRIEVAAASE